MLASAAAGLQGRATAEVCDVYGVDMSKLAARSLVTVSEHAHHAPPARSRGSRDHGSRGQRHASRSHAHHAASRRSRRIAGIGRPRAGARSGVPGRPRRRSLRALGTGLRPGVRRARRRGAAGHRRGDACGWRDRRARRRSCRTLGGAAPARTSRFLLTARSLSSRRRPSRERVGAPVHLSTERHGARVGPGGSHVTPSARARRPQPRVRDLRAARRRGRRSRCRGAGAARRRARPRHRHRRATDVDADRDPDDDREHHRRADREDASTPPTPRTRSSTCRACWCASATSATTTTPCWRPAPRAPATARARWSMPTASCCRTCSATAPAFTPRWGLVTPEEIERVDVLYGPFSAAYLRQLGRRDRRLRDAHADAASRRMPSCRASPSRSASTAPTTRFYGGQASASVGSRAGDLSWWIDVNHLTATRSR